jgi:hypothetical protein
LLIGVKGYSLGEIDDDALMTDEVLDTVLALQLTIAWAGEGKCAPPRLAWWNTDLIDESGGGDLLKRLLPQTHAWAALEAVREAARRVDERARSKMAHPDKMRTLFFLGFEIDEQVSDRLAALKRQGKPPAESLPLPLRLTADFSREALVAALRSLQARDATFDVVPGGRQLKGEKPEAPEDLVCRLAAALVPLAEQYPLPFLRLDL